MEEKFSSSLTLVDAISTATGYNGLFSGFKNKVIEISQKFEVSPIEIIERLGEANVIAGQEDQIIEAALEIFNNKKEMKITYIFLVDRGKIGVNLYESIHKKKIAGFDTVWVYCDGDKASNLKDLISKDDNETSIFFTNYSNFSVERLSKNHFLDKNSKNIIINLRGINNKRDWLNKPLEALDIQLQSCLNIIDSDINLFPNTTLFHLSSQLCDLIEGKNSLQEICEGEDSYRQAYMISRLHQEAILKAYSYKFGIETNLSDFQLFTDLKMI